MAQSGISLDEDKLQLNIFVPSHLVLQLRSGACNLAVLVPNSFSLSQLADLVNTVSGLPLATDDAGLALLDKDGRLMIVRTDEDLRQVYYWHSFVKLHQTQQSQPHHRWGRLLHHVTVWLRPQVALLAPRAVLYDALVSTCVELLSCLGYRNLNSSGSASASHGGANGLSQIVASVSSNGECQLCSQSFMLRESPQSSTELVAVVGDESAHSRLCCCQLQLRAPDRDSSGAVSSVTDVDDNPEAAALLAGRQWSLDDFDFGRERVCLGIGQFGTVHLAVCRVTSKPVALKSIDLCALGSSSGGGRGGPSGCLDEAEIERLMMELKLLADCRHENIVSYVCSFFEQSQGRLYICTEVMDAGSLDKLGLADDRVLGFVCLCAVNGLYYMWQRCIVHRDVKLANILASRQGQVKICDLGLAKEAPTAGPDGANVSTCLASSFCGSYEYMSPERVNARRYGHLADVWSLGVALYELACGQRPFGGRGVLLGQMLTDIREARVPPMPAETARALSNEFHQMYTACLQRKARHRPSKLTIKNCPFYVKYASLADSDAANLREHFKTWVASALSRTGR